LGQRDAEFPELSIAAPTLNYANPPERHVGGQNTHLRPEESDITRSTKIRELLAGLKELNVQPSEILGQLSQAERSPTWITMYRIGSGKNPYLGQPQWIHGDGGLTLVASKPLLDWKTWLKRRPQVKFVVFKDYASKRRNALKDKGQDFDLGIPPPEPTNEALWFASPKLIDSLGSMTARYQDFKIAFPDFDPTVELKGPFLFLFFMFPQWEQKAAELKSSHQGSIRLLLDYVQKHHAPNFNRILSHFKDGKTTGEYIPYLIRPGEAVITLGHRPRAIIASHWPLLSHSLTHPQQRSERRIKRSGLPLIEADSESKSEEEEEEEEEDGPKRWSVKGWVWTFSDGQFLPKSVIEEITVDPYQHEPFDVDALGWFPLRYASKQIKKLLQERGEKFWRCKDGQFVNYSPPGVDRLEIVGIFPYSS
jgi:hypothetical protein